jgi:hypothetical protein
MRNAALYIILTLIPVVGFASTTNSPTAPQQSSRALKIAKRVAENENQGDLPSRAVWLGQRVVKNAKSIAYQKPAPAKNKKRSENPEKN